MKDRNVSDICLIFDIPPWLVDATVDRTWRTRMLWQRARWTWRRHRLSQWILENL